jgi:MFS transporter, CP family, cyanate transporter
MKTEVHAGTTQKVVVGKGLLLVGIVLIAANLRGAITAVGPLVGAIRGDTGVSNFLLGMLTTLPLLAFAALSMLAPKLARRFGTERTLVAAMLVLAGGIALRAVPWLGALYAGTIILGLAIAAGNVLLPSLIKREFPQSVGTMTGLYTGFMNCFAALASGVSIPLAVGLNLGWRDALLCWAFLALVAAVIFLPQARRSAQAAGVASTAAVKSGGLWRSKVAWQVTFFMGLQSTLFYVSVAWVPAILHDRGMSASAAGWMLSLMQFVSLPPTFLVPMYAGRRPSQRRYVVATVVSVLAGYAGLLSGGTSLLALWVVLIGMAQGASISLALMFIGVRSPNARVAAELSGMAQSIGYLLAAAGPILFGFLHDVTNGWNVPIVFLILVAILVLLAGLGAGKDVWVTVQDQEEKS